MVKKTVGGRNLSNERVKQANRKFFDMVAEDYEVADGRRGPRLASYLRKQIGRLISLTGRESLLDLGTGSGFAASVAREQYEFVVGVDISSKMVREAARLHPDCRFLCADSDALPFGSETFDCVVSIAVLHHLPRYDSMLREVYRVLKPGGVFYSDHDIESRFCQLFKMPLGMFRLVRDEERAYRKVCPELTSELYELTEVHRNGVEIELIRRDLESAGFSDSRFYYHWYGLNGIFDYVGALLSPGGKGRRGFAPSVSIWARK